MRTVCPDHQLDADPRTVLRAVYDNSVSILDACGLTSWWRIYSVENLRVANH